MFLLFRTKWLTDKWARGSYCNISSKCDSSNFTPDELAQPIFIDGVPRILLAGEAAHSSSYSTTHGAFESGQTQANIVLDYIKNINPYKL